MVLMPLLSISQDSSREFFLGYEERNPLGYNFSGFVNLLMHKAKITFPKSQHKNRVAAMKVLRSRLLANEIEKQQSERAKVRKNMVSTGDRSAKIRTYNFPQGRVTDHRINLTLYKLEEIMNGQLDELIKQLKIADQIEELKTANLS